MFLVRFHAKYGLRCLKKNKKALYGELFPSRTFVDCGTSLRFEVGPWPYGATKQTIVDFLGTLPWAAKPLKPVRGGHDGRYWIIGSSVEPATAVAPYADQFLTFTKVKDVLATKPMPNVVASMRTLQRLTNAAPAASTADPWLTKDPWQPKASAANKIGTPVQAPSTASSSKLDEIETRIGSKLAAQLSEQLAAQVRTVNDDAMGDSSSRLDRMEVDMQEMKEHQQRFTQFCHDTADRMTALTQQATQHDTKLNFIDQQLAGQMAATERLGSQVSSFQQSFRVELQEQIQMQTASLQAMLSEKKARTERGG